jgi:DNA adenine methylase Dam
VWAVSDWMPPDLGAEDFKDSTVYQSEYDLSPFEIPSCLDDVEPTMFSKANEGLISRMGGKKQLKSWLIQRFPRDVKTYVEPFGGSFQVFLARPWRNRIEIVNDVDMDLIHFYRYVAFDPERLTDFINMMPTHEAMILGLRADLRDKKLSGLSRAAAFYICASSAFNAMATSTAGRYSSSPHVLVNTRIDRSRVMDVARRLQGVDIRCTSYTGILDATVKKVDGGAFYYFDPPYDQTTGYESWGETLGFGWNDHVKLSRYCELIDKLGGRFIQTNSYTDRLVELYGGYKKADGSPRFHVMDRDVYYSVSGTADKRGDAKELIISNYKLIEDKTINSKQITLL